jgi:hypothetical protein
LNRSALPWRCRQLGLLFRCTLDFIEVAGVRARKLLEKLDKVLSREPNRSSLDGRQTAHRLASTLDDESLTSVTDPIQDVREGPGSFGGANTKS